MASKANQEATPRKRACSICVRPRSSRDESESANGFEMLMVEMHDRVSGQIFVTPPGGGIEAGEAPHTTALRETKEETGYDVRLLKAYPEPIETSYRFIWEGRPYDCETSFFLCELVDQNQAPALVEDAYYNRGARWISLDKVSDALDFMPIPRDAVISSLRPWLEP